MNHTNLENIHLKKANKVKSDIKQKFEEREVNIELFLFKKLILGAGEDW